MVKQLLLLGSFRDIESPHCFSPIKLMDRGMRGFDYRVWTASCRSPSDRPNSSQVKMILFNAIGLTYGTVIRGLQKFSGN